MWTFRSDTRTQRKRKKTAWLFCLSLLFCLVSIAVEASEWVYTVQPGDTLSELSKEHMDNAGHWQKLQKLNNIIDPNYIPPGMQIRFPLAWLKIKRAPVRVLELTGEVSATSSQTGTTVLLKPGATLFKGDEIQTGSNGNVLLKFIDSSLLRLQKNSHLIFGVQNTYSDSGVLDAQMHLPQGRLEADINPEQKQGTRFEIHTPAAITGVRGTVFRVSMEADQKLGRTEVTDGQVAVSGAAGETIEVRANFGTVVVVGEPPSIPKQLLPSPDLSQLPDHIDHLPVIFDWPAIDGAELYRAQIISKTTGASALLIDEEALAKPQLHAAELPEGDYLLRVRATDANGLEGMNAEHTFTLVVPVEPAPPETGLLMMVIAWVAIFLPLLLWLLS